MSEDRSIILDCIFFRVPGLSILQGAYLKVERGRITGLFGLNGSGKTTLLKVAAGQLEQDSGIVILDGKRIYRRALRERFAGIAYLPQDSMLPPDMRVRGLIQAVAHEPDILLEDDILSMVLDQKVYDLSRGERRYLELSLVLGLQRSYMILDEPFTGIEPRLIDRMIERISNCVAAGAGFLITDQYRQYLLPLVDQAYLMEFKTCRDLGTGPEIEDALVRFGYLPDTQR